MEREIEETKYILAKALRGGSTTTTSTPGKFHRNSSRNYACPLENIPTKEVTSMR